MIKTWHNPILSSAAIMSMTLLAITARPLLAQTESTTPGTSTDAAPGAMMSQMQMSQQMHQRMAQMHEMMAQMHELMAQLSPEKRQQMMMKMQQVMQQYRSGSGKSPSMMNSPNPQPGQGTNPSTTEP